MMTIATIKGKLNTSIDILMDGIQQVGDVISFNNITNMIPKGENYTQFFYKAIKFCNSNGSTRSFRVDSITRGNGKYEIMVSPVIV